MVDKTYLSVSEHASSPATLSLPKLREEFSGPVIAPGDPEYDQARTVFYGGVDRRPAVIIRVTNAGEVVRVVHLARQTGLELAVRSGGHSSVGHSVTDGGIVLDLSRMKDLQIEAESRTAWAESGLTAGEFTTAAAAHGLAVGFGDTGSVGIGGITLGGGVGFLVRKYGLTIDSLLAAEVVTAEGQILHVDTESHPDLFWAIRGGGGNFGVVTRFKFQLHPVDKVLGGMLFLPATPDIIASFIAEAEEAPEELSTIANVMFAPPMPFLPEEVHGKLIIMAFMVYAGDGEAGARALAPFRALATPLADMVRPISYPEMYPPEEGEYHPVAASRTMFVNQIDRSVAELIVERLQASTAAMKVAQLRVLGGAMSRVPAETTAFAHRASRIMVNLAALYNQPEEKPAHETWVADFARALEQGDSGAYVNFLGEDGKARIRAAYPGSTWDRLVAVKARYDPENLFRLNQNITPERA
ncbi:MAG TPA: FAD-binding oxidoreductase [Anaerolineales bacterium]|nr:FAD-binding oxidoreductase [Anaerolineales bacterium]